MAVRTVDILLFDDVEVLDFAGPFEVFSTTRDGAGASAFEVRTVALERGPVTARNGLSLNPAGVFRADDIADAVLVPGGFGTRRELHNEAMLDLVRQANAKARLLLSVCTGSLLLAKAGVLNGLSATTHFWALPELEALQAGVDIRPQARIVDNGRVITSAGISAGIDMAFHVVSKLLGVEAARTTATYMQYDWREGIGLEQGRADAVSAA